ncbi:MAG: prolipoprotein diacylglyceryl transferase [bacterium]
MFVWTIDPVMFHLPDFIGGRGIRYYGLLYAIALMGGYYFWQWQMLRGGREKKQAERFLTIGVIAVIAGARLGHCLFYEPERYLKNPIEILKFWEGGLSSHGTTIALLFTFWYFARKEKMAFREVFDRISFSIAWGATLIRLGNFMNSEIVGRVTDSSLGVKFPRHDHGLLAECAQKCGEVAADICTMVADRCVDVTRVPWRHPSQLYEAAMGFAILVLLLLVDRHYGEKRRPLGLFGSIFLVVYFSGRFTVEFVKEYQTLESGSGLTMGQYLSIPFVILGIYGIWHARRHGRPAPEAA